MSPGLELTASSGSFCLDQILLGVLQSGSRHFQLGPASGPIGSHLYLTRLTWVAGR